MIRSMAKKVDKKNGEKDEKREKMDDRYYLI
jgi:hypothetical protein